MKVSLAFVGVAVLVTGSLGWEPDCDNIDEDAKAYVRKKISDSKVYLVGLTTCDWCIKAKKVIRKMGFKKKDIKTDNLDGDKFKDNKYAILNYLYCQHSESQTVPQVFINKQYIGGYTYTRHYYYTGQGAKAAFDAGSIRDQTVYLTRINNAAIDFVDEGTARSAGGKYFILSKTTCPHCVHAKNCLKAVGVPTEDIEVHEINNFYTHDTIKQYKQRLTGSPYTPYLAYDGKLLRNHAALVAVAKCPGSALQPHTSYTNLC